MKSAIIVPLTKPLHMIMGRTAIAKWDYRRKEIIMRQFHHFPPHMPPGNFQHFPNFPYPRFQPGSSPFPPNMMRGMRPPGVGAGFTQAAKSTAKLDTILETANRFLTTAQSFQPYIQQAAPMLRNLPAIWKLYKGFQSAPAQGGENRQELRVRDTRQRPEPVQSNFPERERQNGYSQQRASLPRIYQPPYEFEE